MCAIMDVKDDARRLELVSYLAEKGADVNKANVSYFPRVSLPSSCPSCLACAPLGWLVGSGDGTRDCL